MAQEACQSAILLLGPDSSEPPQAPSDILSFYVSSCPLNRESRQTTALNRWLLHHHQICPGRRPSCPTTARPWQPGQSKQRQQVSVSHREGWSLQAPGLVLSGYKKLLERDGAAWSCSPGNNLASDFAVSVWKVGEKDRRKLELIVIEFKVVSHPSKLQ